MSPRARTLSKLPSLGLAALAAFLVLLLAGCGGSDGSPTGAGGGGGKTGNLNVVISGLPSDATASVTVTGPNAYSRNLRASETINGLPEGQYSIVATDAAAGADRYAPTSASSSVTVARGATTTAPVSYAIATGTIALTFNGLPATATPAIAISGPGGFARQLTAAAVVGGLAPGTYTIAVAAVQAGGHTYAPTAGETQVQVTASATATTVRTEFGIATGALTAVIAGLPAGPAPGVTVTGPGGFTRNLSSGETLTNLVPGMYTVSAGPVSVGGDQYRMAAPILIQIAASEEPRMADVLFTLATGRLAVAFSGLPPGTNGSVTVVGPGSFSTTVRTAETLAGLAPGTYTVTPNEVTLSTLTYGVASGAKQVVVTASPTPAAVTLSYTITKGSLSLVINGLPQAIPAAVTITGPGDYSSTAATTGVITGLAPGTYTLTADVTVAGVHRYAATPATLQVTVGASATPTPATVVYALASGILSLTVTGLPPNVVAGITITGPGGYSRAVNGTALLTGLTPGSYTIASAMVQNGNAFWAPHPASQVAAVPASASALQASVNYVTANGALFVNITGLPTGVNADVQITGPNGFSQTVTASQTLNGLLQGGYSVTAKAVTGSGATYTVTPATQPAVVGGGVTSTVIVPYVQTGGLPPSPASLNLTIDGLHVQQVVQSYAGSVPLVAGKDGLLRVFAKANTTNTASTTVRVRLYHGGALVSTVTIAAPGGAVPTAPSQATLAGSWNTLIPGSLMVPGLKILADVDPTNAVTESSDGDNSYPLSGTAQAMDVRSLAPFDVRFVPVTQSANGLTGGVSAGNAASYVSMSSKVFPLGAVNMDVRSPFTTSAPALQSGDANGAWSQILSELNALRTADGSTKFYAGIAKVTYGSGIAGLGYVPGRATLSWDYLPSASEVVAHELGHNFGRLHSPCGGAGNTDTAYPYAGGDIGVYGIDLATSSLKDPSVNDLMGYCSDNWISDYTYQAVLNYRIANPFVAMSRALANPARRAGLLVWGRIHRGQLVLEPAFQVNAPPALPSRPGPNRLQAFGPLGETLFDLSFEGERVADANDPTLEHFAFVVPLDAMRGVEPSRLTLSVLGRSTERRSTATDLASGASSSPTAEREGSRGVKLRWNDKAIAGVLVRDARSGEILTFARGGDASVASAAQDVELTLSDGVRSQTRRVRVGPPNRQ